MLDPSSTIPLILQGLAAEVEKAPNFESLEKDFLVQIKHGLYWHVTDNPNFIIDFEKGPRDMSSMASALSFEPGKLMITSDLEHWANYYGESRPFAALIDMTEVPREAYIQVNRGFGNEFWVEDPSRARVVDTMSIQEALNFDENQNKYLPQSEAELYNFYLKVRGFPSN